MSPTVLRSAGLRFYFFSREEPRCHVHVAGARGEAKFWLEPMIELSQNQGLSARELRTAQRLIEEHAAEFRSAWKTHLER
jgi:hypothetical protein